MKRLRVNIPQADPTMMNAPEACPYEDCDGEYFTPHQQRYEKPLRDPGISLSQYQGVEASRSW